MSRIKHHSIIILDYSPKLSEKNVKKYKRIRKKIDFLEFND